MSAKRLHDGGYISLLRVLGQVFLKLCDACVSSEDNALRHFDAKNVVPMAISPMSDDVP